MTRRDVIIIAALVNAGLLAILFMMAVNSDDEKISNEPVEIAQSVAATQPTEVSFENVAAVTVPVTSAADEVDHSLKEFAVNTSGTPVNMLPADEEPILDPDEESPTAPPSGADPNVVPTIPQDSATNSKYVEITVKKGDSLDKIARANKTTITAIRGANQLKSDRLNIGQKLRIPVTSDKKNATATVAKASTTSKQIATADSSSESQYYTVKSGDNPWKIAKQFRLKVEDLLRLNNMDEERARNLKIGDKIRIR